MLCLRRLQMLEPMLHHRKGHVSKTPGNLWKPYPWLPVRRKKKYKKGTKGLRLDWVKPPQHLRERSVDPVASHYAAQLTVFPRLSFGNEAMLDYCAMTKTLEPVQYDESCKMDETIVQYFTQHIKQCQNLFHSTLAQKNYILPTSSMNSPPKLNDYLKHYSGHFLQNVLLFLTKYGLGDDNMHTTMDQRTAAFWHLKGCKHPFQLMNHIDLIMRSDRKISYNSLYDNTSSDSPLTDRVYRVLRRRGLFTENRQVCQYPGFLKETLYPYNHTVFKVIAPGKADDAMKAINLMTGFGQAFATAQHRAAFPIRVHMIPELPAPEAVHVVVTDTNRFCLGTYQLNTTNLHGFQDNSNVSNMATIAEPRNLIQSTGEVDEDLANGLLSILTFSADQCGTKHITGRAPHLEHSSDLLIES